jgi:hypothetical protein
VSVEILKRVDLVAKITSYALPNSSETIAVSFTGVCGGRLPLEYLIKSS